MDWVKYGFFLGFMAPPEKHCKEHFPDPDSIEKGGPMQMPQILMPQTADMRGLDSVKDACWGYE